MVGMGFTSEEIKDSLLNQKYNEVSATYLLLGIKTEVMLPAEAGGRSSHRHRCMHSVPTDTDVCIQSPQTQMYACVPALEWM